MLDFWGNRHFDLALLKDFSNLNEEADFKVFLTHQNHQKIDKKYFAPEIRLEKISNLEKSAIYSFGVVLEELIKVFQKGQVQIFEEGIISKMLTTE